MAEVTYYYDIYTAAWDNDPEKMVDGDLGTFAYTSADGDIETLTHTICPGTDLGTITKVELRAYGYGDGDDRIDLDFSASSPVYELTMPASEGWSTYVDVTDDPWVAGWTWAKVVVPSPYLRVEFDKVGKGNTMYCSKVEIRVTYTPIGAKVTQYLAGNDCPVFPHEMDLESDKLPCPPPYD